MKFLNIYTHINIWNTTNVWVRMKRMIIEWKMKYIKLFGFVFAYADLEIKRLHETWHFRNKNIGTRFVCAWWEFTSDRGRFPSTLNTQLNQFYGFFFMFSSKENSQFHIQEFFVLFCCFPHKRFCLFVCVWRRKGSWIVVFHLSCIKPSISHLLTFFERLNMKSK